MFIDINTVPEGHSSIEQTSMLEAVRDGLPPFRDVRCRAELDRAGETIYANLFFEGEFELQCSRCLDTFRYAIAGELQIVLKEQPGKSGAALEDDGVDFYFDIEQVQIDISSAIFDEIMIELPLKPLCSSDCAGIAANDPQITIKYDSVGQENNEEIDPRWDALKKLKEIM